MRGSRGDRVPRYAVRDTAGADADRQCQKGEWADREWNDEPARRFKGNDESSLRASTFHRHDGHTGAELLQCQQENMITHVAYKEQPAVKHIANEFLAESFNYDKLTDSYICPAGAVLTS